MLAGDPQCRPVLHQSHLVDVRHLGAADALIHPAYDIAEDALGVVVQFLPDFIRARRSGRERRGQQGRQAGRRARRDLDLTRPDVDLVIVQGVQGRRCRRRNPGRRGARARMPRLGRQHIAHAVRRGPHPLADLRPARQARLQADVDIAVLISLDPAGLAHRLLADDGAAFHHRVDLVARAIQEAGVDEDHPALRRRDAVHQIDAGAALLVHDAHLQRQGGQAQHGLDRPEQVIGEGHLVRAVHLGPHHIDRARRAVARLGRAAQVVQADQARHGDVQQMLGRLAAVGVQHGVGRQVQADVAHQHQAAPLQAQPRSIRRRIDAIGVQAPLDRLAALLEIGLKIAAHQAQPVGVNQPLVRRVDGRDAVLGVGDGRQGRLDQHVGDARRVVTADGVRAVDDDLQMQAVVAQQDARRRIGLAGMAREHIRARQPRLQLSVQRHDQPAVLDPIGRRLSVRSGGQRRRLIQKGAGAGDDARAALDVIAARLRRLAQRIGAVKRVVQAAPARIGRVQQIAGVGQRHDQLRPGHGGDLGVDVRRLGLHAVALWLDVADFAQIGLIGRLIRLARIGAVPVVQPVLKLVAALQQLTVAAAEAGQQPLHPGPEGGGAHTRIRRRLIAHESVKLDGDLQAAVADIGVGGVLGGVEHGGLLQAED
ncbi:hypothetical protein ACMZ4W_01481 [Brevundimonas naejangsanensis]